ncbi:MAG TPA: DUF2510 domain-containing protein [Acidimicrobiales bacterium]|jgi:hypothetical protein|nr:DUF2510 domain-containing protein [Acidimicrobiales bacterium]
MEDGSGWFNDPEVEGQERYFDGSEWTTETRPADPDGPLLHLPDHVPELQRAFAAATADIEEVEAQLGRLFDRAQVDEGKTKKARKASASKAQGDAGADSDAGAPAAAPAGENAQAAGVEALLGTEVDEVDQRVEGVEGDEGVAGDEDDDALTELDAALATEEPEKLKRGRFRRR